MLILFTLNAALAVSCFNIRNILTSHGVTRTDAAFQYSVYLAYLTDTPNPFHSFFFLHELHKKLKKNLIKHKKAINDDMLRMVSEESQSQMASGISGDVWCRRWFGSDLVRRRSSAARLQQTTLLAGASCGRRSLAGHKVSLARCLSRGAKQNVPLIKRHLGGFLIQTSTRR